MGRKKITTDEFVKRAIKVHGYKFDYSNTIYSTLDSKTNIECKIHGIFSQNAADHLNGNGCPQCSGNKKVDTPTFIQNAKNKHGEKYDYSLVEYTNNKTKIKIICPEHGMFEQQPNNHISGQGCPLCKNEKVKLAATKPKQQILNELNESFDGMGYEFILDDYIDSRSYVSVICPTHGEFKRKLQTLRRGHICSDCAGHQSKGERAIREWLEEHNIEYIPQMKFKGCTFNRELKFDYYLPNHNTCIEYNGKQHYYVSSKFGGEEEFRLGKIRDNIKIQYCHENSIPLITIKWDEDPIYILQSIFLNIV